MNSIMLRRVGRVGGTWHDEGDGYYSLIGCGHCTVAYVALPDDHPDVGKDYGNLSPDVNGGLSFGDGNVFGWDYGHAWDLYPDEWYDDADDQPGRSVTDDIASALEYFRSRETKRLKA